MGRLPYHKWQAKKASKKIFKALILGFGGGIGLGMISPELGGMFLVVFWGIAFVFFCKWAYHWFNA